MAGWHLRPESAGVCVEASGDGWYAIRQDRDAVVVQARLAGAVRRKGVDAIRVGDRVRVARWREETADEVPRGLIVTPPF